MNEPVYVFSQWQYTASKRNITGKQGYYVYSYSKNLRDNPALHDALETALGHYCPLDASPAEPNENACKDPKLFPRAHTYLRLPNGWSVLCQTVVVGKEYGGTRYLNFFTHAIILKGSWFDVCNPFAILPDGNFFLDGLSDPEKEDAEKLSPWPSGDSGYLPQRAFTNKKSFAKFREDIQKKFFQKLNDADAKDAKYVKRLLNQILAAFFDPTDPPNARAVIVTYGKNTTEEENTLDILQTTLALLPLPVAKRVEFTTYSGELKQEQRPCSGKCKGWSDSFTTLAETAITPQPFGVAVIFVRPEVFNREKNAYAVRLTARKEQKNNAQAMQTSSNEQTSSDDFQTLRFLDLSEDETSTLNYYASDDFLKEKVFEKQKLFNLAFLQIVTRQNVARTLDMLARVCCFLTNSNESVFQGIDKRDRECLNALISALPSEKLSLLCSYLLMRQNGSL
ncbi:MAG: hypothetical protein Q4G03_10510, partial [Planctomycetia bacterium]|nr:hypothetical protein [Planctomycetia bacterium]